MPEKCTEEIKLRIPPSLLLALARLANAEDRSLSEYMRMVLSLHCFGHVHRLDDAAARCEGCNAPHEGARNNG
jgi:hypothetical protein